ncbi:MAG: IMP dehydrogenase [Alistipes finegoldii]|nr:IMP dehydrogenase [Alistipes finegoldii]
MVNANHAEKFTKEGLTFDDVLLVPAKSDCTPNMVDTTTKLTNKIRLNVPLMTAAMDTVTESRMAIAIAREGGIGVIHKNMTIEEQADQIDRVKRSENGVISNPFFLSEHHHVYDALELMAKYKISGVPICRDGKLVGILTNRDLKFLDDEDELIANVMTKENLVTAPVGTTVHDAKAILAKHKVEKLPIVDEQCNLKGLITIKDIEKAVRYPNSARDASGRLLCAGAIGVTADVLDRAKALLDAGADALVLDSAHGHSDNIMRTLREVKAAFPDAQVIAGNIATAEAAQALIDAGADAIKVGIGPGSICTTRIIAGVGVPQLSAIFDAASAAAGTGVPVIADGGLRYSGDLVKALAAGGDCVMIGSMFAGTEEAPGETIIYNGRKFKSYRGMGSIDAMKAGSADRYFQKGCENNFSKLVPEGIAARVPFKGTLSETVYQLVGGVRAGMFYCGAKDIETLQRARFVRITSSGMHESHPHDVAITSEAPNYSSER